MPIELRQSNIAIPLAYSDTHGLTRSIPVKHSVKDRFGLSSRARPSAHINPTRVLLTAALFGANGIAAATTRPSSALSIQPNPVTDAQAAPPMTMDLLPGTSAALKHFSTTLPIEQTKPPYVTFTMSSAEAEVSAHTDILGVAKTAEEPKQLTENFATAMSAEVRAGDAAASGTGPGEKTESRPARGKMLNAAPWALIGATAVFGMARKAFDTREPPSTELLEPRPAPKGARYPLTLPKLARYEFEYRRSLWRPLLGPTQKFSAERLEHYRVADKVGDDGLLRYVDGRLVDTTGHQIEHSFQEEKNIHQDYCLYVMHSDGAKYIYPQHRGIDKTINHDSAIGQFDPSATGQIKAPGGQVEVVDRLAGHSRPTLAHFKQFVSSLRESGVPPGFEVMLGEHPQQNNQLAERSIRSPHLLTVEQKELRELARQNTPGGNASAANPKKKRTRHGRK